MGYFFKQGVLRKGIMILSFLSFSVLYANSVENLLQEYNQKNALSQKTIDENKGHLVLFSREKLEKMHARRLKDVFKTTPVLYYHQNRYGLPDPLTSGSFEPYRSNFIRLYVDGVEVTQGWMGSGLMLYGDINIDFVDHIEFYYMTPSFETSTEPAYLTIFLYSKDPCRDPQSQLEITQGNRGYNSQSISMGSKEGKISYMVNFSHTDDKREKIENGSPRPLSGDSKHTQLFSYVKSDDQTFHLQLLKKETDGLAGFSYDATPLVSKMDYLNLHMDYSIDFSSYWYAGVSYDWLRADIQQEDDNSLLMLYTASISGKKFKGEIKGSALTTELTYRREVGDHRIAAGVKQRFKTLDSVAIDGYGSVPTTFDEESVTSLFAQNQYRLAQQHLLSFGVEYNRVERNGKVEDDDIWQLRLGYIFAEEHWAYKAYLYRSMFTLDPLSRSFIVSSPNGIKPQTTVGATQELAYRDEKQRIKLMLLYMKDEEGLVQNTIGGIGGKTKYFFTVFNYDYSFDEDNRVDLQLYYAHYKDIFNLDELKDFSGYLSMTNRYGDFDFYNGVVWHRNSIDWKNYFDLTSSVSWNLSDALSLTLKGQNILDKAKQSNLLRFNPETGMPKDSLGISPVDRRITLELEYLF